MPTQYEAASSYSLKRYSKNSLGLAKSIKYNENCVASLHLHATPVHITHSRGFHQSVRWKLIQVLYNSGNDASSVGEETRELKLSAWRRRSRCQCRQHWIECNQNSKQQKNERRHRQCRQLDTNTQ